MRQKAVRPVLVTLAAVLALFALACGNPSPERRATAIPTETGATMADTDLTTSGERFRQVTSYRIRFTIESANPDERDVRVEGESAYRSRDTVYARIALVGLQAEADELTAYLFLPPDLYLQQGDGGWLVQSPWNQGIAPGEGPDFALQEPIVDFSDLSRDLRDIENLPDESVGGNVFKHYRGEVRLSDLPWLGPELPIGVATVELWIGTEDGLPGKVTITDDGADGFLATIEFADYNVPVMPPAAPNARPVRDAVFPDAPCTGSELAGCLDAQTAIRGEGTCAGGERRVCLVPLGKVAPELIDHFVAHYRDQYGLSVTVLTPAAIPAELEDPLRQQVDASQLIDYMGSLFPDAYRDPHAVLIGLTPIDLYDSTSHFRYVFGVKGTPSDPKAIVSTSRMDPQFYGEPADTQLFYGRARKLLSKYIGLLYYQLPASSEPTSPMFDSIGGPGDVDRMGEPLPVGPAQ